MLRTIIGVSGNVAQLSLAVLINLSLFTVIPLTHHLFSAIKDQQAVTVRKTKIVAEYIKPREKKEAREPQRQIRKVQSTSSGHADKRTMDFKFTPDLGVEGSDGVGMVQNDLDAVVFEEGQTDEDATPIGVLQGIPYPRQAREQGAEGLFEAILVIGIDGSVTSMEIRSSPHPSISAEAKKVIFGWKFKPARNQGVPVIVRKKQVIEFKLNS
jgi:TonB family protein